MSYSPWGHRELDTTDQLNTQAPKNPQCNKTAAGTNSKLVQKWTLTVLVTQLCLTDWDPMDCSLPGSSVHGILQARILEWVAMPSSRGSYWPRDWIWASCIAGRFSTVWATREAPKKWVYAKQTSYRLSLGKLMCWNDALKHQLLKLMTVITNLETNRCRRNSLKVTGIKGCHKYEGTCEFTECYSWMLQVWEAEVLNSKSKTCLQRTLCPYL